MPNFDRKGPKGLGTQTGRRQGRCNPVPLIDVQNADPDGTTAPGRGQQLGGRGGCGSRQGRNNALSAQ